MPVLADLVGLVTALATDVGAKLKAVTGRVTALEGAPRVYVQPAAPTVAPGTAYVWVQTGLGANGTDWTVWFDDGS